MRLRERSSKLWRAMALDRRQAALKIPYSWMDAGPGCRLIKTHNTARRVRLQIRDRPPELRWQLPDSTCAARFDERIRDGQDEL